MKVQEGLVFDASTGDVIGFVDVGDIANKIKLLERSVSGYDDEAESAEVADHMLTVMVRGIFFHINFPLGSFATKGIRIINQASYLKTCRYYW